VVDASGRLIGVVSKTDILHRALEGPVGSRPGSFFERLAEGFNLDTDMSPESLGTVDELMSPDPITATPEEPVVTVARRMAENGIHRVIVVDRSGGPIGIVTALDALRVFPE
jgi:CBS domain-containing protein